MNNKRIFALLGASATGKTTIGNFLKKIGVPEIVSHTTREPREGEKEGVTYYYVNESEFENLNKIEEVEYAGNKYAFTKDEIDDKLHKNDFVYLIADRNGIEQLKEIYGNIVKVIYFYSTPSECFYRLEERDGVQEAIKRLSHALEEGEFDNFDISDYIVRSKTGNLDKLKAQIRGIVTIEIGDVSFNGEN
ncbi:MAG: hypothetical protein ACOC1K_01115 [Nanoarchaeota archaeon]